MNITFKLNKLIRDKIADSNLHPDVKNIKTKLLEDDEVYHRELINKIIEEAHELQTARGQDEILEEISDMWTVLQYILKFHGLTEEQVKKQAEAKLVEKGGFDKRIFAESITIEEDSDLKVKHLSSPEKYPMI